MSTKLHHGYRIADGVDLFELIATLGARLGDVWINEQRRRIAAAVAARVDRTHLSTAAGLDAPLCSFEVSDDDTDRGGPPSSPIVEACLDVWHRVATAAKSDRRSPDDLSVEVTFLVDPTRPGGHLAILYTQNPALRAAFCATDGIEPWPYWDNTDRPDDVDADDWAARGQAWNDAVGWDPPATRGLTWTLTAPAGGFAAPTFDELVDLFPTTRQRARQIAPAAVTDGSRFVDGNRVDYEGLRAECERVADLLEPHLPTLTAELCAGT